MADYPVYEIKITYACQLCEIKHVAINRIKGGMLAQELATGGKLMGQCLEMAKRGVVKEFFKAHPKAKISEFIIGEGSRLKGLETITHSEDTIDHDDIGVPMLVEEVSAFRDELIEEGKDILEEKSPEELEKAGPIETGVKPGMSYEEVKAMVENKLKELEMEHKRLAMALEEVVKQIGLFKGLVEATQPSKTVKATSGNPGDVGN